MDLFKQWKWALFIAGGILIASGLIFILLPNIIIHIMPILIGIILLAVAGLEIAFSLGVKEYKHGSPLKLAQGVLSLVVGIIFIFKRNVSLAFLGIALGLWAVISAILKCIQAFKMKKAQLPYVGVIIDAVIRALIGVFMMFNPFASLAAWTVALGVVFALAGGGIIAWTIYINKNLKLFKF